MSAVLDNLNTEQKAAVETLDGPVLIVAGAGSGKTRVLTSRIARAIELGVPPENILALTFTKKAAGEMKDRIALMVGARSARRIVMGTFHSVFVRFLRDYAHLVGYPQSFTIYDTSDSTSAIKTCVRALGLDENVYKPKEVLSRISMAKNNLFTASMYAASEKALTSDRLSRKPDIWRIYKAYDELCRRGGVMDFDDILLNTNILLRDYKEALEEIASRFTHILVDEYQDTNMAQYVILKKLCLHHRNICVVGDDSQSIYAFRGARIENILNFKRDYPDARVFRLEMNYRSTRPIVNAANSLIEKNVSRIPKTCRSVGDEGEKIRLIRAYTEQEEAALVASAIFRRIASDKASYDDFAILYRTNSQSRALEEALRKRNLPYMVWSGNSFFERAEVKDMMAYLKLVVNRGDDEAFRRIVNKPARGIGDTTVNLIRDIAAEDGISLFAAAASPRLAGAGLRAGALAKLAAFCNMINEASSKAAVEDAYKVASHLADVSGLYRFFKDDKSVEGMSRAANVEELLDSIASFVESRENIPAEEAEGEDTDTSLSAWLEDTALLSNADVEDGDASNKIALMTVHSAKGLEFPYVFIAGLEENLFPGGGGLVSETELEEERRLFYVALTRAGRAVELSFAENRMRNGKRSSNPPSRFIREIDERYLANPLRKRELSDLDESFDEGRPAAPWMNGKRPLSTPVSRPSATPVARPFAAGQKPFNPAARPLPPKIDDPSFVPASPSEFSVGQTIEHNRFGRGTIKALEGEGLDRKATVDFERYGVKILLLKYAKMRILG